MVDYVPLTKADLGSFDKEAVKHVTRAVELGWVGRVSSKGHCIMLAPDGETTMRVPPIMDAPGHGARNARAALRRWEREQEPAETKSKRDYAIPIHNTVAQAVPKETVEQVKEAVTAEQKEEPMPKEEQAKKPEFEMYIPPVKALPPVRVRPPHLTITKTRGLYLSAKAMDVLGSPERVNVSVNVETAEMMVWADRHGHMSVSRNNKSRTSGGQNPGTIGATDLVRHFDLPTSTRWVAIDQAPGRILFSLTDETTEEKE